MSPTAYRTLRGATYVRLRDEGIQPVRPINHGPTVSLHYKIRTGQPSNCRSMHSPSRPRPHSISSATRSGENPIGVLFDPEELVRAYDAGVPEQDLLRRPQGKAQQPMGAGG
jgi:hypothetical protein